MADLDLLTNVACDPARELVVVDDTTSALDELLIEPAQLAGVSTVVLTETHLTTAPRWGGSWVDLCWHGGVLPGFWSDDAAPAHLEAMANVGAVLVMADAQALLDAPGRGARWLTNLERYGMIAALDLRPATVTAEQLSHAIASWTDAGVTLDHCVTVGPAPGPLRASRLAGHRSAQGQLASPG